LEKINNSDLLLKNVFNVGNNFDKKIKENQKYND
jgi:hypothetical protein